MLQNFSLYEENRTKGQFQKMIMRFARFIIRPIMKTAIATAIGDDLAATLAGLFRNFSEGVLILQVLQKKLLKVF